MSIMPRLVSKSLLVAIAIFGILPDVVIAKRQAITKAPSFKLVTISNAMFKDAAALDLVSTCRRSIELTLQGQNTDQDLDKAYTQEVVSPNGTKILNKSQSIQEGEQVRANPDIKSVTIDLPYAKVYGDIGVVNSTTITKIGGARPYTVRARAIEVFIKRNNSWKKLHSVITPELLAETNSTK